VRGGLLLWPQPPGTYEWLRRSARRWKNLGTLVRLTLVAMLSRQQSFAEAEALSDETAVPMRRELGLGPPTAGAVLGFAPPREADSDVAARPRIVPCVQTRTSLTLQTEDIVDGLSTDEVDTIRAPYLLAELGWGSDSPS
jgi:hypothetical protein